MATDAKSTGAPQYAERFCEYCKTYTDNSRALADLIEQASANEMADDQQATQGMVSSEKASMKRQLGQTRQRAGLQQSTETSKV